MNQGGQRNTVFRAYRYDDYFPTFDNKALESTGPSRETKRIYPWTNGR